MRKSLLFSLLVLFLFACAGADSITKKSWKNSGNTIRLKDLTARDFQLLDAGARLQDALEEKISQSSFRLAGENARYTLKYKILEFDEGSRAMRIATFGLSDSASGLLKVKVGLFRDGDMVGAWTVDSWGKGGVTGGTEEEMFAEAAEEIVLHLRGDR